MSQAVGVGSATCDIALPLLAPAPFSGASRIHSPRLSISLTLSPSLSLSPSVAAEPVRWLKRASLLETRPRSVTRVWMRGAIFPRRNRPPVCASVGLRLYSFDRILDFDSGIYPASHETASFFIDSSDGSIETKNFSIESTGRPNLNLTVRALRPGYLNLDIHSRSRECECAVAAVLFGSDGFGRRFRRHLSALTHSLLSDAEVAIGASGVCVNVRASVCLCVRVRWCVVGSVCVCERIWL